ncbi:MAG: hypothetical protein P8189_09165 [Anaerolineae bacterium]|jgi:hypothetical protein
MNFPTTPSMLMAHQDLLLSGLDRRQTLKVAKAPGSGLRERALARVGSMMVFAGLELLERYEPALSSRYETSPTVAGGAGI